MKFGRLVRLENAQGGEAGLFETAGELTLQVPIDVGQFVFVPRRQGVVLEHTGLLLLRKFLAMQAKETVSLGRRFPLI